MTLTEAIQRAVIKLLPPKVVTGTVVSVDKKAMTCDVDIPFSPKRYDVRLRSVIDNVASGLLIIPKVKSKVVVDTIEGNPTSSYVVMFSEVEEIQLIDNKNGGLIISSELVKKINALEKDLNSLKTVFKSWAPTPNDGGALLKSALTSYFSQNISLTKSQDIESKTVSHG